MTTKSKILFLSHGGGPLPLLGDAAHTEMVSGLKDVAARLQKPSAIIVISAHWETGEATITASAAPSLIYDYYGFPEASYRIRYPCKGEPVLARQIYEALEQAGIEAKLDPNRGFDHGLFVPLKIMYPDADIPCVQVSLHEMLDPQAHIDIGLALRHIDYENLFIIGSGFSFHNMKAFFAAKTPESVRKNTAFEAWLADTCSNRSLTEEERKHRLILWEQAPGARYCHPREEHLMPLHVCYGAAGRACDTPYELNILGVKASMYLWL